MAIVAQAQEHALPEMNRLGLRSIEAVDMHHELLGGISEPDVEAAVVEQEPQRPGQRRPKHLAGHCNAFNLRVMTDPEERRSSARVDGVKRCRTRDYDNDRKMPQITPRFRTVFQNVGRTSAAV
jgi:hypothetical protein